jgi:hypothetical protein
MARLRRQSIRTACTKPTIVKKMTKVENIEVPEVMASPITLKVTRLRPESIAVDVKIKTIGKRIRVLSKKNSLKSAGILPVLFVKNDLGRSQISSTMTLVERVGPRSFNRSHALPQQFLGLVCVVYPSDITVSRVATVSRVTNVLSVMLIFSGDCGKDSFWAIT